MRLSLLAVPLVATALVAVQAVPAFADDPDPFPGFTAVESYAQGQVFTGYLFAVGDEETRLFGASASLNGPPAGSEATAAFVQRGLGGHYVYGFLGGGQPGKKGVLPDPPPGEADGFFPANPQEGKFEGPISTGTGQAADSRFTAKATPTPSAVADAAGSDYNAAGQFEFEFAHISSHTEPGKGGVVAESRSVLHGLTIGPLRIDTLTSIATGLITPKGKPVGTVQTIVTGATVSGTAVQITDQGIVVSGSPTPGAQQQVNQAMASAGYSGVAILPATMTSDDDGTFHAITNGLQMIYRNDDLGANNPQGFSGGGLAFGGASIKMLGRASDAPIATHELGHVQNAAWTAPLDGVQTEPALVRASGNGEMTPKVAADLRHGYLAFGIALTCLTLVSLCRVRLVRRRLLARLRPRS